jgi:MerR family transcriptional regulator, copper efflux regulator
VNIGQAAKAAGLSAKAIRYYETAGLIGRAGRSEGGYRIYTEADIRQLHFIRRARDLGFSIERIGQLLDLWRDKDRASADVKRLTLEHVSEIEAKIAALTAMRDAVQEVASACDGDHRPDCPILHDLEKGEPVSTRRLANRRSGALDHALHVQEIPRQLERTKIINNMKY